MKKLILLTFFSIFISVAYSQTDNHMFGPVAYRTPEETIGETYLILPLDKSENGQYIMLSDTNGDVLKGHYGGRSVKLISIDRATQYALFKDSVGTEYKCLIGSRNMFSGVVPLKDFEAAKMFKNKTLWLNIDYIRLGNPLNLDSLFAFKKGLRFERVTVTSVTLGSTSDFPFVFMIKTAKGDVGFVQANVSGTNTGLDQKFFFGSNFFTEDPKVKYHFSPAVWENVKAGHLALGMEKDAVILAIGIPKDMNNSTAADGLDQWVYPTRYLYFRNNKLVDIRNQ